MILRNEAGRGISGPGHIFIGSQIDPCRRADPFKRRIGPFLPLLTNAKDLFGAGLLVIQNSGLVAERTGFRANLAGRQHDVRMEIQVGPLAVEESGFINLRVLSEEPPRPFFPFKVRILEARGMNIRLDRNAVLVSKPERKPSNEPDLVGQR